MSGTFSVLLHYNLSYFAGQFLFFVFFCGCISLVDSVLCLLLWLYFAGRFCSLSSFVVVLRWSILFFVFFCGCISLVDSVLCLLLWLYFAGRFCSLSSFVVVFRWSILFFVFFCGCISLVDSVLCLLLWLYFAGRFCSLSSFCFSLVDFCSLHLCPLVGLFVCFFAAGQSYCWAVADGGSTTVCSFSCKLYH